MSRRGTRSRSRSMVDRVRVRRDETIWHAARRHGVTIPHGCLSSAPDFRPEGNCRLCVVEVEGYRTLQPSCLMKVRRDSLIRTDSERAVHARRLVMELLLADAAIEPLSECGRVASTRNSNREVASRPQIRIRPATRATLASPWTSLNAFTACGACKRAARSR